MEALGNILILMMLIFCIFAIMGCYLFGELTYLKYKDQFFYVNENYNTDNFYNSFLLTFRAASGEAWPNIMLEYASVDINVVPAFVSQLYFILLIFFCAVIMLNLFILVVLQQYDEFHQKEDNPIERFSELLEHMNRVWNKMSAEDDKGERINMINVTQFLFELEGDLALDLGDDIKKDSLIGKKIMMEKIKFAINAL